MTRAYFNQQGFNYGRLGPLLRARTDIKYYEKACKTLINMKPAPQGPAIKRKGTVFVKEIKSSATQARLVKFIFSEIDSYVLEFGNLYIRFYQDESQVESGMSPYEIVSPYSDTQVADLQFAQLGDIMYIAHPSFRPYKLSRLGATNWTLAVMDNTLGPVEKVNKSATTITLTGSIAKDGTSTWTASASMFQSTHVGSVWAITGTSGGTLGYARMASYTSATVATFTNQTALFGTGTASTFWHEASWSGVKGYPRAVAFHEQRLFWAGTNENPLTVYGSVSNGAYEVYDIDNASADDAPVFELTGRANTIQWMLSNGRFLVAGTFGGLAFADFSAAVDSPIPTVYNGSSYGSSQNQGVQVNSSVLYASSNRKSLYRAVYNDISLQYDALDLNDLSPDFLNNTTNQIDVIEQPDVAVVMVEQGKLKILNYEESQSEGTSLPLIGWYSVELDGEIESVAVVPTTGEDRVWVIVKRTINGATKRYVEFFDISSDDVYLDSAKKYDSTATRTFTGLSHLEGKTVQVWGDGAYAGEYVVTSGTVTIPNSKSAIAKAYIGLGYVADLEIMPINIPIPQTGNSTMTLLSRINEVQLILYKTLGLKAGDGFANLKTIPFRSTNDAMDSAPPLFGNDYPDILPVAFSSSWGRQQTICIRSDLPFPCTVLGLMARMEVQSQ